MVHLAGFYSANHL